MASGLPRVPLAGAEGGSRCQTGSALSGSNGAAHRSVQASSHLMEQLFKPMIMRCVVEQYNPSHSTRVLKEPPTRYGADPQNWQAYADYTPEVTDRC
ncbi:hypothetical protein DSO57_1002884 [Entomophthora muscae]|uniref:Uncharacterized protein n=1 Tax=Entomophthora muscae TaxID=34485 RepID=A0ACC2TWH9_9FUNG|nr:hypothetical protein DSO57_1002884 [Entomophthora muscae]